MDLTGQILKAHYKVSSEKNEISQIKPKPTDSWASSNFFTTNINIRKNDASIK